MENRKGFTFVETLIVIGIITLLATAVVVAINPVKRFEAAKDKEREIHLQTILSAIERKMIVESGWVNESCPDELPSEIEEVDVGGEIKKQPLFKIIGTGPEDPEDPEAANYYNLFGCLVPKYLVNPLYDPDGGSATNTKYDIWQNPYTKHITLRYRRGEVEIIAGAKKYPILDVPLVTIADTIENITHTSAEVGGDVVDDRDAPVLERGVIWSEEEDKLELGYVGDTAFRTVDGSGTGSFTSHISGLVGSTIYHVRAYAKNQIGVGYSEETRSFSTADIRPVVETLGTEGVTDKTAVLLGKILSTPITPVYGYFCWGESEFTEE